MSKIYCSNCGQLISANSNFCGFCGAAQHGTDAAQYHAQAETVLPGEAVQNKPQDIVAIPKSHLAPRAIWLFFFSYFKKTSILIPALIVGAILYPQLFVYVLIAVIAIMFIVAILVHNNFIYEIDAAGLEIDSGIIHKKHVSIPFEQVQNVNIERSILDQIFGLARISIETAGSSSPSPQTVAGFNGAVKSEAYLPGIDLELSKIIHDTLIDGASDAI